MRACLTAAVRGWPALEMDRGLLGADAAPHTERKFGPHARTIKLWIRSDEALCVWVKTIREVRCLVIPSFSKVSERKIGVAQVCVLKICLLKVGTTEPNVTQGGSSQVRFFKVQVGSRGAERASM